MRQRVPEDAEELFALTEANRARLREWLPWLDGCTRVEDTRANIEATLRQAEAGTGLAVCLWSEGRIAGVGGYNVIDRANLTGHIGYWLGGEFEGRGLMTAANRALVAHGFTVLGLRRQTIAAATGNVRSRAVAERLGFAMEGVLRESEMVLTDGLLCQGKRVIPGSVFHWPHNAAHRYDNPTERYQTILCVDAPAFRADDEVEVSGEPADISPELAYPAGAA